MITHILAVDPGSQSGWAIIEVGNAPRPVNSGQLGTTKRAPLKGSLMRLVCEMAIVESGAEQSVQLAIEGQFLPSAAGMNQWARAHAVDALETARVAGMWRGVAESMGIGVWSDTILANTWRRAVWGRRVWRREQSKIYAVTMANRVYGCKIKKTYDHEAEAVWIGVYAAGEIKATDETITGNTHT
jgi:hypothetical protein